VVISSGGLYPANLSICLTNFAVMYCLLEVLLLQIDVNQSKVMYLVSSE
jgi:hypothetical protein